nr:hypothetical protein [Rhizobium sp. EC-SD404]
MPDAFETDLNIIPQIRTDDAQLGDVLPDPQGLRVCPRYPIACSWVADIALPVPDENTLIEVVAQDPRTPCGVAPDGRVTPSLPVRTGDAFHIQGPRDRLWRMAAREVPENTAHDCSLAFIDGAQTAISFSVVLQNAFDVIAIGTSTT